MIDALLEHSRARIEPEIEWSQSVLACVRAGLYGPREET